MKIDTGVVGSPDFNDVWILDGDYEFRKQTTTGIDECADIDDDNIATIRLEFQWVKPCLKRISSKKSCLECSKLRDQGESSQPAKKSRRTSYSTSIPIDPNQIVPGLVHEDSKRAHGFAAISHTYRDLKDDEDENFRFHGTFKDQNTLRFFIGPEEWLESKGWIEPRARAPETTFGAEQSSIPPSVASEQDSDQSPGPAKKCLQSGFGQWAGKGNPLAIDKGNTCTQAELGSTSTAAEQIIDIDDDDEDEKPLISSSPPTSIEIKRESSDTGEEQPGANLESILGLLLREVRRSNALMRQMNEGFDRLVQSREQNTNSH
ncbi:hypothetical protein FRC08_004770 [Ceratobasidium sp. 394]|nr:hypothetical protein FRC08_004770 [Ceratobasidium sp. 394]